MAKDSPVKRRRLVDPYIGRTTQTVRGKSRLAAPGEQLRSALSTALVALSPRKATATLGAGDSSRAEYTESQSSIIWVEDWHPNQYNLEDQLFEASLQITTSEFFGYDRPIAAESLVVPQDEPGPAVLSSVTDLSSHERRAPLDSRLHHLHLTSEYLVICPLPLNPTNPNHCCHADIPLDNFTAHLREEHSVQGCTFKDTRGNVCGFNQSVNFKRHLLGSLKHCGKVYGYKLSEGVAGPLQELPRIACKHCGWVSASYVGGNPCGLTKHIQQGECPKFEMPTD
ncbi:hypothetical protein MD484_g1479, partial [Candolleomyces efflorescens]